MLKISPYYFFKIFVFLDNIFGFHVVHKKLVYFWRSCLWRQIIRMRGWMFFFLFFDTFYHEVIDWKKNFLWLFFIFNRNWYILEDSYVNKPTTNIHKCKMFRVSLISRGCCTTIFNNHNNRSNISTFIFRRTLSSLHDDNKAQNQKIIATDRLVKPMERVDGKRKGENHYFLLYYYIFCILTRQFTWKLISFLNKLTSFVDFFF